MSVETCGSDHLADITPGNCPTCDSIGFVHDAECGDVMPCRAGLTGRTMLCLNANRRPCPTCKPGA